MAITKEELDRLVDETHHRGLIAGRVYCGKCGYNLKTLPYVYRCPECGNEYNARPLTMKGIFLPYQHGIPIRDLLAGTACGGGAAMFAYFTLTSPVGINPSSFLVPWVFVLVLGTLAIHFAWRGIAGLSDYARSRSVARRIAAEEADEE